MPKQRHLSQSVRRLQLLLPCGIYRKKLWRSDSFFFLKLNWSSGYTCTLLQWLIFVRKTIRAVEYCIFFLCFLRSSYIVRSVWYVLSMKLFSWRQYFCVCVCPLIDNRLRHNPVKVFPLQFLAIWRNLCSIRGQRHKEKLTSICFCNNERYFHCTCLSVHHSDLFLTVFSSLSQRWITALTIPAKTTEHVKFFQMATIALVLENSKDKTAKVWLAYSFVLSSVIWINSVSFAFFPRYFWFCSGNYSKKSYVFCHYWT